MKWILHRFLGMLLRILKCIIILYLCIMCKCDYYGVFNYMIIYWGTVVPYCICTYILHRWGFYTLPQLCCVSCHAYVLTLIEVNLFKVLVAFHKLTSKIKEQQSEWLKKGWLLGSHVSPRLFSGALLMCVPVHPNPQLS